MLLAALFIYTTLDIKQKIQNLKADEEKKLWTIMARYWY